jgi:fucose permease
MSTMMKDRDALLREARYYTVGWILLAVAILAVATTILATAATPHVLWLFSTSYGAVMMVVGVTLIRVGHRAHAARGDHAAGLESCRP